ncbi:MAG: MFS transporter [Oscillospiraceae bacterium]
MQSASLDLKRTNRSFMLLEATFFSIMFLTDGFFAEILSMFGYSDSFIGIVLMAMGIACVIFQPLFGYFCDKYRNYRALFFCVYGFMAVTMPLFFYFHDSKLFIMLYSVITLASSKALFTVLDSWISKIQKEVIGVDYGKLRSFGSISFAVAAFALSQVMMKFGNQSSVWLFWIIFSVMTYALYILPNPSRFETEKNVSIKSASKILFKNRNYVVFLICSLLVSFPHVAVLLFSSRLISSLGGDVGDIGFANFIMAASEFFVILNFTKIANKLGTELTLGLGMLGTAIKAVLLGLCPTAGFAMLALLSQTFSYALLIPGAVRFIGEQVPRSYIASAMVMYQTLCQSLAQIIGSPFYGALAEKFSVGTMLLIMSISGFFGSIGFIFYCRSPLFIKPLSDPEADFV